MVSFAEAKLTRVVVVFGISTFLLRVKKQTLRIAPPKITINPKQLGYTTLAFVGIYLDKAMNNPSAVTQLKKINEVIECHFTTGDWSVLVKILCKDNEHLMNLLNNQIQKIPGISRTETFISLDQQIGRQITL